MASSFKAMAGLMAVASSAVSGAPAHAQPRCQVVNAGKLSASSGGAKALCAAMTREIGKQAPGLDYHATVTVLSASRLSASVDGKGRTLAEQKFSSMDRALAKSSFDRFAKSVAAEVAASANR
jgi:hypothetical protein